MYKYIWNVFGFGVYVFVGILGGKVYVLVV